MSGSRLPAEFASLEPYAGWALESEREWVDRKLTSSPDEIRSFCDAMMGQINEVLDYLDKKWGEERSTPDQRLQLLLLSLVEISTLVELYGPAGTGACLRATPVRADIDARLVDRRLVTTASGGRRWASRVAGTRPETGCNETV